MKPSAEIANFVREARKYNAWVETGTSTGIVAAREVLELLVSLYGAALHLPHPGPDESHEETPEVNEAGDISHVKENWEVLKTRLPFEHYAICFSPQELSEEPVVAALWDDIADIHRDIIRGLELYELEEIDDALWEWNFNFHHHWGRHATSAIAALHNYLTTVESPFTD